MDEKEFRPMRGEDKEIVMDEYDFGGCQVVRREFFSHTYEPSIRFTHSSVQFNTACLKKITESNYVQFLLNPEKKQLIIKPCGEDERAAVRWCSVGVKDGKRKPREIKGNIFTMKLYDMLGWNTNYKYKLLGVVIRVQNERLLVFNLEDTEVFTPTQVDEDGTPLRHGRKPHFPLAWKDSFGLPVEEHAEQLKINVLDGFARFQVVKPKPINQPSDTGLTPGVKVTANPQPTLLDVFDDGGNDGKN